MRPIPRGPVDALAMRHREAAFRTELGALGLHAYGDFGDVRHELGAQPHRVGGASLTGLRAALGSRWVESNEKCGDRQRQPANETHSPQHLFLSLVSCGLLPDAVT